MSTVEVCGSKWSLRAGLWHCKERVITLRLDYQQGAIVHWESAAGLWVTREPCDVDRVAGSLFLKGRITLFFSFPFVFGVTHVHMYLCVCMWIYVCVCGYGYMHTCRCEHTCMCAYTHMYLCVCTPVYLCVSWHVSFSFGVQNHHHHPRISLPNSQNQQCFYYQMPFYLSSNPFRWWLEKVRKEGVDKAHQAESLQGMRVDEKQSDKKANKK